MNSLVTTAGYLLFFFALLGAALRTGPDDPITAGLKSAGLYQPYLAAMTAIIFVALIYAAFVVRKCVKMQRYLNELKRKGK